MYHCLSQHRSHGPIFCNGCIIIEFRYGLQAQKEEKSLDTDERVLQLLQDCMQPVKTIDIAKALGFKTAKQVRNAPLRY